MTRDELIAKLQEMPENVEVKTLQRAHCCCGECFLPMDGHDDTWSCEDWKDYILIS